MVGPEPGRRCGVAEDGEAETTFPSNAQVHRAILEADGLDPDFGVFGRLTAATGARRGELCGLRWSSVDLDHSMVRIETNVIPVPGGTMLKDTKNHAKRDVPLDLGTVETMRRHRQVMDDRAGACGVSVLADGFVFSHAHDGSDPWHPDNASEPVGDCARPGRARPVGRLRVPVGGRKHVGARSRSGRGGLLRASRTRHGDAPAGGAVGHGVIASSGPLEGSRARSPSVRADEMGKRLLVLEQVLLAFGQRHESLG